MQSLGWKVLHYQRVTSTNDLLKSMEEYYNCDGVVVTADEQTRGRGQYQRTWFSPADLGLYFSIMIKPRLASPKCGLLALYSAVAAGRAIRNLTSAIPQFKWPNDILLNGKKIAGILIETCISGKFLKYAIVGIGVNLNQSNKDFPDDIRSLASSLLLCTGQSIDKEQLLNAMITEFNALYPDVSNDHHARGNLIKEWLDHCSHLNQTVVLDKHSSAIQGIFHGVNEFGQALVRVNNKIVPVHSCDQISLRSEHDIGC